MKETIGAFHFEEDEFITIALAHYNRFKESAHYDQKYKWYVLKELNEFMERSVITKETVGEIVHYLKKENTSSGYFVYWRSLLEFERFSITHEEQCTDVLRTLYDDEKPFKERLNEATRQSHSCGYSLGAPLLGYLLAAFDYTSYPMYKKEVLETFKNMIGAHEKLGRAADNYSQYVELCKHLLPFVAREVKHATMLDVQDFLYCITKYRELFVPVSIHYLKHLSEKPYEEAEDARVCALLKMVHGAICEIPELSSLCIQKARELTTFKNDSCPSLVIYTKEQEGHVKLFLEIEKEEIRYGIMDEHEKDMDVIHRIEDFSFSRLRQKYETAYERLIRLNRQTVREERASYGKREESERQLVSFEHKVQFPSLYFEDEERLKRQIQSALKNGKHLIFAGPPGTGKSKLASEVCKSYGVQSVFTTASSDWSTFETIGGYHPTREGTLAFHPGLFLQCFKDDRTKKEQNKWLIVDEMNRADLDQAFGALLSVLAGDRVSLGFQAENGKNVTISPQEEGRDAVHEYSVPSSWRLIGTMNTRDKATLFQMSYAFMRRFAFISIHPPSEITEKVLLRYMNKWGIESYPFITKLTKLWHVINQYEQIGPALIQDVALFTKDEGDFTSAFQLFLWPQIHLFEQEREFMNEICSLKFIDEETIRREWKDEQ
ncbi:AAA family ATPase [Priestia endophytica]|uniref:AAA+ ATPase domain-containing protein n=1 Tax=Priestia endophytica TaxID=135735 RepID=A0AAX1Q1D6_9BACI|nr:AAA family ATPase [Priestia endophytica]RAS71765.1 hypothetical protein A3864_22030 [Priestia endophytica]RAS87203.1 hypothetical protein A3863_17260 [Priestia endophytica]